MCGVVVRALSHTGGRLYLIENNTILQPTFELPDLAVSTRLRSHWLAHGDTSDSTVIVGSVYYTFSTISSNEMVLKNAEFQGILRENFFYSDRGMCVGT